MTNPRLNRVNAAARRFMADIGVDGDFEVAFGGGLSLGWTCPPGALDQYSVSITIMPQADAGPE